MQAISKRKITPDMMDVLLQIKAGIILQKSSLTTLVWIDNNTVRPSTFDGLVARGLIEEGDWINNSTRRSRKYILTELGRQTITNFVNI